MSSVLERAAEQRIKTINATSEEHRHALAQHLTPPETAYHAASLFSDSSKQLRCLDLGCGTGMLSIAFYERYQDQIISIDGIETDPILAKIYDEELANIPHTITIADVLTDTPSGEYDRVILNPPYKKMAANDPRQIGLPVHSANLYSAFVAIALSRLADDGECSAIIPRSWTNGEYFTPFRKWALTNYSLDSIHIYGSRTEVFKDTAVLQETMLVRFSNRPQAKEIIVSHSGGKADEIELCSYPAAELITGEDLIVRVAPPKGTLSKSIAEQGYCPSTGKVVDFRSRERIYQEYEQAREDAKSDSDIYRLVYTGNFRTGKLVHPAKIGKAQWYRADDKASKAQLTQPGSYVLVKRFTAKEERRRVVAYPITITEPTAFENHTSFIHAGTPRNVIPLPTETMAKGLSLWLNSTFIDEWFRDVSGSTQVNAKDIKAMPCPDEKTLFNLGKHWQPSIEQDVIDTLTKDLI